MIVRFRIWVDGPNLIEDSMLALDLGDDAAFEALAHMAEAHGEICGKADQAGLTYLVDVEFEDGEHVRWGTDVNGMVLPVGVGILELTDAITRRWG